jgi:hypothetical protein
MDSIYRINIHNTAIFVNTYDIHGHPNRHVHEHYYLYCAGIKPAISCVVSEYLDHCAILGVSV